MRPQQSGALRDEKAIELANQARDRKRIQYDADLTAVLSTRAGRSFAWRLIMDTAQLLATSGSNVALELARHDGYRAVGTFLTNEIRRVCPREFVRMWEEQLAAQQAEDSLRAESQRTASKEG